MLAAVRKADHTERQAPASQPVKAHRPTGLLRRSSKKWIVRHATKVVAGSWLLTRAYLLWLFVPSQALTAYLRSADLWLSGQVPYLDFPLEYGPGALALFTVPRLLSAELATYQYLFAGLMLAFDVGTVFVLRRLPIAVFGNSGNRKRDTYSGVTAAVGYLALTTLAGALCLNHFALVPAFFTAAFVCTALRRRHNLWLPELLLAFAIWVKPVSVILVLPLAALRLAKARRSSGALSDAESPLESGPRAKLPEWPGRSLAQSVATLVAFLAVLSLPFYLLAESSLWQGLLPASGPGVGVHSVFASVSMLFHHAFSVPLRADYLAAPVLTGPVANGLASAATGLLVAGQLAVGAWFAVRMYRAPASARNALFARAVLAQLVAFLVLDKGFASQDLLWVAPLCAVFFVRPAGVMQRRTALVFAIFGLSWVITRFHALGLQSVELLPSALAFARNALVVLLLAKFAWPEHAGQGEALRRAERRPWKQARAWALGTAGLFAAWVVLAGLTDETDADVYFHLKIADDILSSLTLPTVDIYSATAAGRPFVAHEWLSGVVFLGTLKLFGPNGLSWLVAALALACTGLMFLSLPQAVRRSALALPLLMLASYAVLTRVHMRPHVFSLVFEGLLMIAIERWRVTRLPRAVFWLVPMQVLWVNMHGGALLAPTIVGVVLAAVVLCACFPKLQSTHPEDAPFSWKQARQLMLLEVGLLAATLVNPYGPKIFPFAIKLGSGPNYIAQLVTEWRPTLHLANRLDYWFWPYLACLAVLVGSLIMRRREKPVVDLFLALTLAWISLRARRFLGEFAVLTLPILARSIYRALDDKVERRFWLPGHRFNAAVASLMLVTVLAYDGLGINPFAQRHTGIGMAGNLAYSEVASIKALDLQGAIMNDYEDGGLIIRELSPNMRPVIDPRIDIYGPKLILEWMHASLSVADFVPYADKYGVNVVMRRHFMMGNDSVRAYLTTSPDWQLLPSSRERYLYVRKQPISAGHAP